MILFEIRINGLFSIVVCREYSIKKQIVNKVVQL